MPKIDNISELARIGATGPGNKPQGSAQRGKSAERASAHSKAEPVHLSGAARRLADNSGPPVDTQRVAEIRREVISGHYKVDAASLAQKISDSVLAVLKPAKKQ